ncbi:MAG: biopolymer transporter ExbD [Xanthomonadales bacterium]|nr:biopolymer transporter ExbD [Xanthomonadales bacterium]ODU95034.1 MAG: biopolymer transporter ExbD [Rhodanobacter sp. SCN 66-43]OJY82223.1 MAG: biopolymer transporter ExbD [Xanthomonadales bacterium 66-474]
MSMSVGENTGSDIPKAEINVTPLADVMLVLLIIFMITAPLMSHKVKVDLPRADPNTKPTTIQVPPIDLAVEADGTLYWNDSLVSDAVLTARLRAAASSNPQPELNIRADKTTPYRVIWKVMQDAKGAGMVHLGFITQGKARNGSGS